MSLLQLVLSTRGEWIGRLYVSSVGLLAGAFAQSYKHDFSYNEAGTKGLGDITTKGRLYYNQALSECYRWNIM